VADQFTKEELDAIIQYGSLPNFSDHPYREGDRIELNFCQKQFQPGTKGVVTGLTKHKLVQTKLDIYPSLTFNFHHTAVERDGWLAGPQ
jgi:hypothetical protein